MATFVTTEKGEEVSQKLWKELMQELSFAEVQQILDGFKK